MNVKCKSIIQGMGIFLSMVTITGCFPERYPVGPEESATRRPQVSHVVPFEGDIMSSDSVEMINVWFDHLMDQNTIPSTILLSLTTSAEEWTNVDYINHLDQNRITSQNLAISRSEQGSFFSEDEGTTWHFIPSLAEQVVNFIKFDPENTEILFAATDSDIQISEDGGENWTIINNGLPLGSVIMHLSFDPTNSKKLWLGTSAGIYKSIDGGQLWEATGVLPQWTDQEISQIAIDRIDPDIIYVSTLGRFIYKSVDDGNSWELKRGNTSTLGTSRIYDIIVDPDSSNIIYVASINQGVYKSIDAAENWFKANNGIENVNARILHFHAADNNRLYVACADELFMSTDKGENWLKVNETAESSIVSFFGDAADANTLYLATVSEVYQSNDRSDSWQETSLIDEESIRISGTFQYSTWQDSLTFYILDEDDNLDSIKVSPYRYNDALASYDVGLQEDPPVDPDPQGTKVEYVLNHRLYSAWQYRLVVRGAFEGNAWRGEYGARNLTGMSLEYDYIIHFFTK